MNSDFVDQQGQIITESESADRQGPSLGPSRNRVFCSRKLTLCDDIFTFWQTNIKCSAHPGDNFCAVLVEF